MSHLTVVTNQDDPMTITGTHPYADKFPMLPDAELAELAESIRANGLRMPITITPDGLILDGRNRAKACEAAGVEPTTTVYDGDDLAEYVIDANTARRHMSTGARAMATALVLTDDGRRENGRWKRGSVLGGDITESRNTWKDALRQAGMILDHAPDVAEAVVNGELALDAAYKLAEDRRDAERRKVEREQREAEEEAEAKKFIEDRDPKLAARVDGEDLLTYQEAKDLWERRNSEEAAAERAEKAAERKKQADLERGWRDTCSRISECVGFLDGGKNYGRVFLEEFYPHESQFLTPVQQLTREKVQKAIDFLEVIREGITK